MLGRGFLLALPLALLAVAPCLPWEFLRSGGGTDESELLDLSLSRIDLNTADFETLLNIPGMSRRLAGAILARREEIGCLQALSDLLGSAGVTAPDLADIKPYVFLGRGCRRAGRVSPVTILGWRAAGPSDGGGVWRGAWTWDLRLHSETMRLRARHSAGRRSLYGGLRLRAAPAAVTLGDFRGRLAPPLVFEMGRGSLSLSGPLAIGEPTTRGYAAGVATGTSERVRGAALEVAGATSLVALAGAQIKPWGVGAEPLALVSVCRDGWGGLRLQSAAAGWGKPMSGLAHISVCWGRRRSLGSAGVALRRGGGAWLFTLLARPGRGRRFSIFTAGRWGAYSNPVGLRLFRTMVSPEVAYRMTCSTSLKYLGSMSYEELGESGGNGKRYLTKIVKCRKRLQSHVWMECEARAVGSEGAGESQSSWRRRLCLKGIWRPPGGAWAELLFKGRVHKGERSSLCGWRAGVDRGVWGAESGGFSYRAGKSLYFYEKELAGLPSIKALKGAGLGWYLYFRLEPPKGSRPMSFMGSTELKLRVVLDRDSPSCGTTFGLQFVWR